MLQGTKKLFPTKYAEFKDAMMTAAKEDALPVVLQLDDIKDYTLKDIQDMFHEFQNDTGLNITGTLFICDTCNNLHLLIEVDYKDTENTLLQ